MRVSAGELAEQTVLINNGAFKSVACREWLSQKWGSSQRRPHSSDQIRLMAELFGAISLWVQVVHQAFPSRLASQL
jgi:hypothetical protein